MIIPGLSSIKNYGLIIVSFALVIMYALLGSEKKLRAQENLKRIKRVREIEKSANEAMRDGIQNEKKALDNIDINDDDKLI